MPNTPALVSAGCAGMLPLQFFKIHRFICPISCYSVYCLNEHASCKHADVTMKIFESVGICHQVPESQLNAFTGLSGSGPAYVSWWRQI
jgi:pyrroline-5-carboxylate reductase